MIVLTLRPAMDLTPKSGFDPPRQRAVLRRTFGDTRGQWFRL